MDCRSVLVRCSSFSLSCHSLTCLADLRSSFIEIDQETPEMFIYCVSHIRPVCFYRYKHIDKIKWMPSSSVYITNQCKSDNNKLRKLFSWFFVLKKEIHYFKNTHVSQDLRCWIHNAYQNTKCWIVNQAAKYLKCSYKEKRI